MGRKIEYLAQYKFEYHNCMKSELIAQRLQCSLKLYTCVEINDSGITEVVVNPI